MDDFEVKTSSLYTKNQEILEKSYLPTEKRLSVARRWFSAKRETCSAQPAAATLHVHPRGMPRRKRNGQIKPARIGVDVDDLAREIQPSDKL